MTSPDTEPLARLAGVSLHYGEVAALEEVDLTIPARQMVAMIGPDGVANPACFPSLQGHAPFSRERSRCWAAIWRASVALRRADIGKSRIN